MDNLHMKFLALNVDISSPSPDLLGLSVTYARGIKEEYRRPEKRVILPLLAGLALY